MSSDEGAVPPTGAGLMRYFDTEDEGPKIHPKVVIGAGIAVAIIEVLLNIYGSQIFGI